MTNASAITKDIILKSKFNIYGSKHFVPLTISYISNLSIFVIKFCTASWRRHLFATLKKLHLNRDNVKINIIRISWTASVLLESAPEYHSARCSL